MPQTPSLEAFQGGCVHKNHEALGEGSLPEGETRMRSISNVVHEAQTPSGDAWRAVEGVCGGFLRERMRSENRGDIFLRSVATHAFNLICIAVRLATALSHSAPYALRRPHASSSAWQAPAPLPRASSSSSSRSALEREGSKSHSCIVVAQRHDVNAPKAHAVSFLLHESPTRALVALGKTMTRRAHL